MEKSRPELWIGFSVDHSEMKIFKKYKIYKSFKKKVECLFADKVHEYKLLNCKKLWTPSVSRWFLKYSEELL